MTKCDLIENCNLYFTKCRFFEKSYRIICVCQKNVYFTIYATIPTKKHADFPKPTCRQTIKPL